MDARWESGGFIIRLAELVWEACIGCVEFGSFVFDVDHVEGTQ